MLFFFLLNFSQKCVNNVEDMLKHRIFLSSPLRADLNVFERRLAFTLYSGFL